MAIVPASGTSKLVGKGLNSDVFDNGDGTVLKVYRPEAPATLYLQDYEISVAVSRHYEKMPAVLGLKDLEPYPGLVFEKIDGPNLLEAIGKNLFKIGSYAKEFATTHLDIHRHSFEGLPRQKDALLREIAKIDLPRGDVDDIIAYTGALPDGDRLCHNDYMPTNVVLSEKGIVVIDWRTATRGNALADVARTLLLHEVPREDIGIPAVMELVRRLFIRVYLKEYLKLARVAKAEVDKWMLPLSAVRLGEGVSDSEKRILLRRIGRQIEAYRSGARARR